MSSIFDGLSSEYLGNLFRIYHRQYSDFIQSGSDCRRVHTDYTSPKITGFTEVKGRRRLSKKKRKQLKAAKK